MQQDRDAQSCRGDSGAQRGVTVNRKSGEGEKGKRKGKKEGGKEKGKGKGKGRKEKEGGGERAHKACEAGGNPLQNVLSQS